MTYVYTWQFRVRSNETDPDLRVRPAVLQTYLEETAIQGSASLGYDYAWYRANQRVWVARHIHVRYYTLPVYGDDLTMHTWVSDAKHVQSHREYDLRRTVDDAPMLRGRCNWVYLDTQTMRPTKLIPEFHERFDPSGHLESLNLDLPDAVPLLSRATYSETRRVAYHEVDGAHHVNNTVYAGWSEATITNALREMGWTPQTLRQKGLWWQPYSRRIDFQRSAQDGDFLRLTVQPVALSPTGIDWRTTIQHAERGDTFVVDHLALTLMEGNTPVSLPESLRSAVQSDHT
ncbi:MAG TPA: acyl-CoA thioesterase [Aggregatilineales bacterium]|nr:acyl-CoA thioesterase [Anaerolineales bacterium]HRE48056.1 acyl-CoA thioesterase [Aggregatilineales bacterium]